MSFNRSAPVTLVLAAFLAASNLARSTIRRASFSLFTIEKMSPNCGNSLNPVTVTGVEGPASFNVLPEKSSRVRTLPYTVPATKKWPGFSLPCSTRRFTTEPLPFSICASITRPSAGTSVSALSSSISATSNTISSRLSIPSFCLALIGTIIVSPPHSSGLSWCSLASCAFTLSGLAPSLSILLMATTIRALALRAKRIASTVCGITPSSAATTIMTTSVRAAPC